MGTSTLTTDHPAWRTLDDGRTVRQAGTDSGPWSVAWDGAALTLVPMSGAIGPRPVVTVTLAEELPDDVPAALRGALDGLGEVHRLSNPWLWDAITSAMLRQIVQAAHARALYERWCSAFGAPLPVLPGALRPVPDPRTVLGLSEAEFAGVGARLHRTGLRAAARAYLHEGVFWERLAPAELADALCKVERIGPWTARTAAADFTGDYSIYPHGDLAVRTWAAKAAPDVAWHTTDREFSAAWCAMARTPRELHTLTLLTLTWGSHAAGKDCPEQHAA